MLLVFFFGCCLGLLAVAGGSISGGAIWDSDDFFGASGEGADFFSQNVSSSVSLRYAGPYVVSVKELL